MNSNSKEKILLQRFSSFGDVTQCLSVVGALKKRYPDAEIHWVTRKDMAPLLWGHPGLDRVWTLDRKEGFPGLLRLVRELRREKFTRIYDAHNNLRSRWITFALTWHRWIPVLRRKSKRWKRFLLFRFRMNLFRQPFSGQRDLLEPLSPWGIPETSPPTPQIFFREDSRKKALELTQSWSHEYVALAPSAAFYLKRWPPAHWEKLIELCPQEKFLLLGGPEDRFLNDIANKFPQNTLNVAGKSDLGTSVALVAGSKALVSNDTGLLHVAEQLGVQAIALMGPAPFGFPSREKTKILELPLACRPCSKHGQGPCRNPNFHQCLVDISPLQVERELRKILGS